MCPTKSLISLHFLGVVYHNSDDEAIYDRISGLVLFIEKEYNVSAHLAATKVLPCQLWQHEV